MSGLKDFTQKRLAALNRNPFEAARMARLERSFVNDILIDKKQTVIGGNIAKLAFALSVEPSDILAAMGRTAGAIAMAREEAPPEDQGDLVQRLKDAGLYDDVMWYGRQLLERRVRSAEVPPARKAGAGSKARKTPQSHP